MQVSETFSNKHPQMENTMYLNSNK